MMGMLESPFGRFSPSSTGHTDRWRCGDSCGRGGVLPLALASSGHRDGSFIRMKRIFRINRILLELGLA
jgi:hypothetical protein